MEVRRPYAGQERRPTPREPETKPQRMPQAVPYLRKLRAWVVATPDARPVDIVDKIDDLIFQARGGK